MLIAVCLSSVFSPVASGQTYIYGRADFPVGNNPRAIASGDFNGDGKLDFAVVNYNDGTVSILLGKPDGTLASKVDYQTNQQPTSVVTGDFNGDGNLDLAVTNENCHGGFGGPVCDPGTVSILLGNGDGTFQSPISYATGTQPLAVAVGDVNADGNLDLVTANNLDSSVSVLLGSGDGSFKVHTEYATGQGPNWVVAADFNADHKLDLAVATSRGASILLGNGDGTFQTHSDYQVVPALGDYLVAEDFNKDGRLDFAVTVGGFVYIFLGNGDGTFINTASYTIGSNPSSILSEDFNRDGKADLAIVNGGIGFASATVSIFLGNGDGTFQPNTDYGTGFLPGAMAVADVNGDGTLDLAVVATCRDLSPCSGPGAVSVLLGFGDGTFVGKGSSSGTGSGPSVVLSADFNHDGKLDLAIPSVPITPGDYISVLLGNGNGTFQPALNSATGPLPYAAAVGDFNGDGNTDLVTANMTCQNQPCGSGSVSVLLGKGDGTFQPHSEYATGVGPISVTTGDFNGDGKPDLAVANWDFVFGNSVSILLGNGDGTFRPHVDYLTGSNPRVVVAADFNGDGRVDLAVGCQNLVSILLGNGDGTFQPHVDYQLVGGGSVSIVVADFNGDGKADLAVGSQGLVSILLGNGDGTFQPHVDYSIGDTSAADVHGGDFNGDGILDLAVGLGGSTKASILLGKGDGTFTAPVSYQITNESLSSFNAADFDGDGVPDLVGTDANLDLVSIILSVAFKAVYPTTLNFGSQGVGTTSGVQTITLSNPSHVSFGISGFSISGDFTETNNCGVKLAPRQNCTINVQFSPSTTGTRAGAITLTDGTRSSPQTIPLTGAGINGPFLAVSPGRLTFDPQAIGSSSNPATIGLANTGNSVLQSMTIGVTGPNSADFSESNTCGSSLAAGSNCAVSVTFKPSAAGARLASIAISDSAVASPQLVALTGTGLGPVVSLSAGSLTFASQGLGTSSSAQSVVVTNVGGAPLSIAQISVMGDFAQTNNCPASLAAGTNCTISVTFTPTTIGTRNGTVSITDNAADSPETISLSGTTTPTPLVSVTPSNITFPAQYVGTSGLPQSVTVTNNGNAPLSITSVTTSAADFGTLNACGSTVAPGSSCAISVFLDPTASGARSGTLTINDNAPGSPQTVALSGTGQDFSLAPVSPASTTVSAGQTANYTVAVSPAGGFNQTVALTCTGGPALSTCAVTPSSVQLNGTVATNVAISVTTMAALPPLIIPFPKGDYRLLYLLTELLVLPLLIGLLSWHKGRPRLAYSLALLVFLSAAVMMSACGGGSSGGNQGTPPGSYPLVVSGTFTSGSTKLTHNANLTLVVQ